MPNIYERTTLLCKFLLCLKWNKEVGCGDGCCFFFLVSCNGGSENYCANKFGWCKWIAIVKKSLIVGIFMARSVFVKERLIASGDYYYYHKKQGRLCCKKSNHHKKTHNNQCCCCKTKILYEIVSNTLNIRIKNTAANKPIFLLTNRPFILLQTPYCFSFIYA